METSVRFCTNVNADISRNVSADVYTHVRADVSEDDHTEVSEDISPYGGLYKPIPYKLLQSCFFSGVWDVSTINDENSCKL